MKKKWSLYSAIAIIIMISLAGYARWSFANDDSAEKIPPSEVKREVFVSGAASLKVEPDQAYLQLGIVTEEATASASQERNALISQKVIATLEEIGIEAKDIRTVHYGIQPMYKYVENRQPELIGYQTSQQLSITLNDLSLLGETLDRSVKAGANRIHQISFGIADPSEYQMKALEDAVKDARKKAEIALGADHEKVLYLTQLSIGSGMDVVPAPYKRDALGGTEQGVPQLMPGQTDITVTVQAVFSF